MIETEALAQMLTESPPAVRAAVGGVGLLLLLFGARLYRVAVLGLGFAGAAIGTHLLLQLLAPYITALGEPEVALAVPLVAGGAGAATAWGVQRLALAGTGAVLGVIAAAGIVQLVAPGAWWVLAIGALVGGLLLPLLFQQVLKLVTPVCGALLVAVAAGFWDQPWWVLALAGVGAGFQLATGGKKKRE